jgi:hypothetical protein
MTFRHRWDESPEQPEGRPESPKDISIRRDGWPARPGVAAQYTGWPADMAGSHPGSAGSHPEATESHCHFVSCQDRHARSQRASCCRVRAKRPPSPWSLSHSWRV